MIYSRNRLIIHFSFSQNNLIKDKEKRNFKTNFTLYIFVMAFLYDSKHVLFEILYFYKYFQAFFFNKFPLIF